MYTLTLNDFKAIYKAMRDDDLDVLRSYIGDKELDTAMHILFGAWMLWWNKEMTSEQREDDLEWFRENPFGTEPEGILTLLHDGNSTHTNIDFWFLYRQLIGKISIFCEREVERFKERLTEAQRSVIDFIEVTQEKSSYDGLPNPKYSAKKID